MPWACRWWQASCTATGRGRSRARRQGELDQVARALGHALGTSAQTRVVREELAVRLHVGAAAGRVDHHDLGVLQLGDPRAGHPPRRLGLAVVHGERPAAPGRRRADGPVPGVGHQPHRRALDRRKATSMTQPASTRAIGPSPSDAGSGGSARAATPAGLTRAGPPGPGRSSRRARAAPEHPAGRQHQPRGAAAPRPGRRG